MRATGRLSIRRCIALRVLMWAAFALPISATALETARADCRDDAQALKEALAARDLDAVQGHFHAILMEVSCSDSFRERAGRAISMAHARIVQERMAAGASLASQRTLLEQGLSYARTWPVLALLGDAAHDAKDFDGASVRYQEALVVIDDAVKTPRSPPQSEIKRIFRRAAQSQMLATDYQPPPKTRSGAPSGLAATSIRGIAIERVEVPITFHTGSAEFTDKGRRAAADMVDYLSVQKPGRITIAGHTDPRGDEADNLALSRERAETVARYLRDRGFLGLVDVVAKGESERFPIDDPSAYSREQRLQMDRRVELIR